MNCPDCGREIKQEKYSGGESYPKYHRAVDCISNLRADLERKGTVIGPNDMMIAATAMAHHATLVTHNMKEFKRVKGLKLVDWF